MSALDAAVEALVEALRDFDRNPGPGNYVADEGDGEFVLDGVFNLRAAAEAVLRAAGVET